MLMFWAAVLALSLAVAGLIVFGAVRAAKVPADADPSLVLYRRQLSEIDDLVERGLLDATERRTAEAETGRRLLAAAELDAAPVDRPKAGRTGVLVAMFGAPAAALALYLVLGAPGTPDQPFAARLAQWRASDPRSLGAEEMAAVLKAVVAERPDDPEGLRFLGQVQLAANSPFEAEANLNRAVLLAPDRADIWTLLGRARAEAAGKEGDPGAVEAFRTAVARDPTYAPARYFLGRARIAQGDAAAGLADWRALLADLPGEGQQHDALSQEIAEVERTGQVPGAQGLDNPQVQTAVRGMVDGLAARLAANPDDPEGWVRLVRAYTVLGETARRDEALAQARTRYKDQPEVLQALQQALEVP